MAPRKTYKRYKARTPETKARISKSVRTYHERCKRALALLFEQERASMSERCHE